MKIKTCLLPILIGTFLLGCGTSTTMHYDLNVAQANSLPTQSKAMPPMLYRLASIKTPEPIDTTSLVVRQPNDTLMVLSHDKWVSSLSQVMQTALSAALTNELGMPALPASMTTAANAEGVAHIIVDVRQFEMQPAKEALLSVLWQINFHDKRRASITCYTTLTQPVAPGVAALVAAQQVNVQALGKEIAQSLRTARAPQKSQCLASQA
jgi:uncharacterized protein